MKKVYGIMLFALAVVALGIPAMAEDSATGVIWLDGQTPARPQVGWYSVTVGQGSDGLTGPYRTEPGEVEPRMDPTSPAPVPVMENTMMVLPKGRLWQDATEGRMSDGFLRKQ